MKTLLDDLLKLLQSQVDLYKKLLEVLSKENEIILSASVEALTVNNKKKEVVILQIKLLDESCLKLVDKIYQKKPGHSGAPSLAGLIENSSHPSLTPLKSCYASLLSVAHSVRELNIINERLIKGSLRAIMSSISFLASRATSGSPMYENTGQLRMAAMARPMLSEEA